MVMVTGSNASDFPVHPDGPHAAVCIDVIDLGPKTTKFGTKNFVRLVFGTEADLTLDDGSEVPGLLMSTFTLTIGRDSNLRKFMESWRGRPFSDKELEGYDLDGLFHVPAMLNVVHVAAPGRTKPYANIASVSRLAKGMQAPDIKRFNSYVPVRSRSAQEQQEYINKFVGAGNNEAAKNNNKQAPASKQPAASNKKATAPANGGFEDFPGALQDEDDDLPF